MSISTKSRRNVRRGAIVQGALALVAVGTMAVVAISSNMPMRSRRMDPPPQATRADLDVTLRRLGISPESLVAAGVAEGQVAGLVGRTRGALASDFAELTAAEAELASARADADRLERTVRSGLATPEQITSLTSVRAQLQSAQAVQSTLMDGLLAAALAEGLSSEQLSLLAIIRSNKTWDLPTEYKVRTTTEADWVVLRDALASERIALREGIEVPSESAAVLRAWHANSAVAAARAAAINLGATRAAWDQAIAGGG